MEQCTCAQCGVQLNNPLHSLIYSCSDNWTKINPVIQGNGIKVEISIMQGYASDEVKSLLRNSLEKRINILETLLEDTKSIQENWDDLWNTPRNKVYIKPRAPIRIPPTGKVALEQFNMGREAWVAGLRRKDNPNDFKAQKYRYEWWGRGFESMMPEIPEEFKNKPLTWQLGYELSPNAENPFNPRGKNFVFFIEGRNQRIKDLKASK